MCARRAPGKILIVRLETSISGQRLSIAHPGRPCIWERCSGLRVHIGRIEATRVATRRQAAAHVVGTKQESERCLAPAQGRPSAAFVHDLAGRRFTLKIVVRDCPVPGESFCTTIGEDEVSTYLSVPPSQTRAFEEQVTLRDMPESTKWGWTYIVQEVRGTLK